MKSLAVYDNDCRHTCSEVFISSFDFSASVVKTQMNKVIGVGYNYVVNFKHI